MERRTGVELCTGRIILLDLTIIQNKKYLIIKICACIMFTGADAFLVYSRNKKSARMIPLRGYTGGFVIPVTDLIDRSVI